MKKEDLYEPELEYLSDFCNEVNRLDIGLYVLYETKMVSLHLSAIRQFLKKHPLQTVEERYLKPGGRYYHPGPDGSRLQEWRDAIASHPKKVKRINACVRIINACKNKTSLGRAVNEILRLLYGKDREPWIQGKRYDPDRLEL